MEQPEEGSFALGFVAGVTVGMIIRGQGIAFVMVQAVAVGSDTGHEDITPGAAGEHLGRGFNDGGGGAALPVVDEVIDDVEGPGAEDGLNLPHVIPVGLEILDLFAEVVIRPPVQDGDFVAAFSKSSDKVFAGK